MITCLKRVDPLALLCVMFSCVFVTLPYWCPRSCTVVLVCIDAWSLPSSLLCDLHHLLFQLLCVFFQNVLDLVLLTHLFVSKKNKVCVSILNSLS